MLDVTEVPRVVDEIIATLMLFSKSLISRRTKEINNRIRLYHSLGSCSLVIGDTGAENQGQKRFRRVGTFCKSRRSQTSDRWIDIFRI